MRLRAEGIVTTRREGKSVIYQLARSEVEAIVTALRDTFCRKQ
jgi:DNA-binding transcriptional ArsR family regulator